MLIARRQQIYRHLISPVNIFLILLDYYVRARAFTGVRTAVLNLRKLRDSNGIS